jgi:F-type H+-transporting ATPase subunit epsilon
MTSAENLILEIFTPTGVVLTAEVMSCSAPGVEGAFQILKGHTDMVAALGIGMVKVMMPDNSIRELAISGGFLEVKGNKISILADSAELAGDIDSERAEKAANRARKRLEEKKADIDFERARAALHRALNRLKVSGS